MNARRSPADESSHMNRIHDELHMYRKSPHALIGGNRCWIGVHRRFQSLWLASFLAFAISGCAIGPNYSKPSTQVPEQWKEAGDWVVAQPKDAAPKGKWWEAFNDPVLNGHEEQVEVSNQTLAAAEARYRQARAAVQSARSQLFPIFSGSGGGTRNRAGTSQVDSAGLVIG